MPAPVAAWVAAALTTTTTVTATGTVIVTASSFAVYATVYAAAYVATTAAIAYGTSQLMKPKGGGSLSTFSDQGRNVMVRDPAAPQRKIYGQVLTSGMMYPVGVSGTKNEDFHFGVIYAGHEVEEVGDLYFGDELIPLSGSWDATNRFATYAHAEPHRGEPGQAVDNTFSFWFPTRWTSDRRGDGIAYDAVRLKHSPDLFPGGLPVVKRMIKGAKCYDPRDVTHDPDDSTTWDWTQNAALICADYLHDSKWGKGVPWSRINTAALIAAANICDETIVLSEMEATDVQVGGVYTIFSAGTTNFTTCGSANNTVGTTFTATAVPTGTGKVVPGAGLTEKRYAINGTVTADQDSSAVLGELAAAMAGSVVDTGGYWTINAGAYRTPTVTLGDGDLAGPLTVQPRMSRQDTFNGVKGVYISPLNSWQLADFPVVTNATYTSWDGGLRLWKDIALGYTTSSPTTQRLAKIDLERGRQQITFSALYKLSALNIIPGDVVSITRSALGWSSKPFECVDWALETYEAGEGLALGVRIGWRETASGVWDWNNGEETTVDLAPNTDLPDPFSVPTPTGLTLLSDSTTAIQQADGVFVPRLKLSWNSPNNIYVEQGGKVAIQFKRTADATWRAWPEVAGDLTEGFITDVKGGTAYDVRIQFVNHLGVRGPYQTVTNYTVNSDVTSPANVTSFAATAIVDGVKLDWVNPSDTDFSHVEIYYSTSSTPPSSGTPATIKAGKTTTKSILNLPVSLHYFYARTRDLTGNPSAYSSAVTATPLAVSSYVSGLITGATGTPSFYQTTQPSSGMVTGSLWWDTDDNFKVYRYNGTTWQPVWDTRITTLESGLTTADGRLDSIASEYVLSVTGGNRLVGFRVTSDGGGAGPSLFTIQADKFNIVNTSGTQDTVPFLVDGSGVYIDQAVIRELDAGKIAAGTIMAALTLGSAGSLTVGSGDNTFYVDGSNFIYGNPGVTLPLMTMTGGEISFAGSGTQQGSYGAGAWSVGTPGTHLSYSTNGAGPFGELVFEASSGTSSLYRDSGRIKTGGDFEASDLYCTGVRYSGGNRISFDWIGTDLHVLIDGIDIGIMTVH